MMMIGIMVPSMVVRVGVSMSVSVSMMRRMVLMMRMHPVRA